MKGNDGTGNNELRDSWQTPQKLFDQLNEQYKFNFDCCANDNNSKCEIWTDNFLNYDNVFKHDINWMNPPFSKAYEMFEHFFKVINKGICIYRCDNMETKIWQELILKHADWIFVFNKRINYEGQENSGARFPSALIGFNIEPPNIANGVLFEIK